MTTLLQQQQALMTERLRVLRHLQTGLEWSLQRLPKDLDGTDDDPALGERIAAIVDRYCKLQDQLTGSLRHAHAMLGEKYRSFQDVVAWAVTTKLRPSTQTWLELRSLRNRLTHEYEPTGETLPELLEQIGHTCQAMYHAADRLSDLCNRHQLIARN